MSNVKDKENYKVSKPNKSLLQQDAPTNKQLKVLPKHEKKGLTKIRRKYQQLRLKNL